MRILAIETSTEAASAALVEDNNLRCEYILNDGKKHSEKLISLIDMVLKSSNKKVSDVDVFAYSTGPGSFTGLRIGAAAIKGIAQGLNRPIVGVSTLDALAYNAWVFRGFICPILDAQRDMVYSSLYCHVNNDLIKIEDYRAISIDGLIERLKNEQDMFKATSFLESHYPRVINYVENQAHEREELSSNLKDIICNNDIVFLGDGVKLFRDKIAKEISNAYFTPGGITYPRASSLAILASIKYKNGEFLTYKDLELNYVRQSHAETEYQKKNKAIITPMKKEDIEGVFQVESASFDSPWSKDAFYNEMKNEFSVYLVAKIKDKIVGYGGMWIILDEGHITNIAVHKDYQSQGIGNEIVKSLIKVAEENFIERMTLEVKPRNAVAIGLYKKHNFKIAGIRKNYYSDTKEDALIMWKEI